MKHSLKKFQTRCANGDVTLATPINLLFKDGEFGGRAYRALLSLDCTNTADILAIDPADLHEINNVGANTVAQVMAFVLRYKHLDRANNDEFIKSTSEEQETNEATDNKSFEDSKANIIQMIEDNKETFISLTDNVTSPIRIIIDIDPNEWPRLGFEHLPIDMIAEDYIVEIKPKKKRKVLDVIMPNGEIIHEAYAYLSMVRFIELIGEERVASLNIETLPGIPLVSKDYIDAGSKKTVNNWYVYTGVANKNKVKLIKLISEKLSLNCEAKSYTIEQD